MTVPRRASARLRSIPLDRRPSYGPDRRKTFELVKPGKNGLNEGKHPVRVTPRLHDSSNNKPSKVVNIGEDDLEQRKCLIRVSPRLKDIPTEKRPYYGTSPRKPALDADSFSQEKCLVEVSSRLEDSSNTKPSEVVNIGKDDLGQEKCLLRFSTRLKDIASKKRPYYDASPRKLELDKGDSDQKKCFVHVSARLDDSSNKKLSEPVDIGKEDLEQEKCLLRVSPRLKDIPSEKRPYYGASPRKLQLDKSDAHQEKCFLQVSPRLDNSSNKKPSESPNVGKEDLEQEKCLLRVCPSFKDIPSEKRPCTSSPKKLVQDESVVKKIGIDQSECEILPNAFREAFSNETSGVDLKAKMTVKKALRLYNKYQLQSVQEEEKRCQENEDNGVRQCKRPDLKAIRKMSENKESLYREGIFGSLPGIEVGDRFNSRAEMAVVGLHRHWLSGIDYKGPTCHVKLKEYEGYELPLAMAIVLSGQYQDNRDDSEEIIYIGQGGNDLLGNKRQVKDQVLSRGNLALKRNMEQKVPVRVIRGYKPHNAAKFYVYAGLYKVVKFWKEIGEAGFNVFKYKLNRLEGQKELANYDPVHFVREKLCTVLQEYGVVCHDLSNGLENKCVRVINLYNPLEAPPDFKYIRQNEAAGNVTIPPNAPGCKCKGKCTNWKSCSCARLNGGDFPYVHQDGGRLIEPKAIVFECGPNCGCGPDCVNRTSQQGLKYTLEVFRSEKKGWAVRSRDFIPPGAPVCEYVGVLRKSDELESVLENDYIFEIDGWKTMFGIGGREKRMGDVSVPVSDVALEVCQALQKELKEEPDSEFCIDAGSSGNVARFINHSCEPNLFVQCVVSSHHDLRLARVLLFAADPIPPMQELTYDYGYALDSVIGPNGSIKKLPCYCGAADCRKRLY